MERLKGCYGDKFVMSTSVDYTVVKLELCDNGDRIIGDSSSSKPAFSFTSSDIAIIPKSTKVEFHEQDGVILIEWPSVTEQ
jgi:hypothetical protein